MKEKTVADKMFYLNRDKSFSEIELIEESPYKRTVKFLEGDLKNKQKDVHPNGVAWGGMYPRVFKATTKPQEPFMFRGRVLAKLHLVPTNLTPKIDENYRFQSHMPHVLDAINARENVLLTGGTGTGKTSGIEQLAARTNQSVLRINFNGETRLSDLIGKLQVLGGETRWVDGILPMAMRHGYWLLLDEIDFADPSILSLLHPVLEENPCLVLKENSGEVIHPHENFRIFGTANSIGAMSDRASTYTGTNTMNEAFLDRWQVLMVNNLSFKEELKIVKKKVGGLKSRWANKIVSFAQQIRENKIEGLEVSFDNFSTRKVLNWAKKTALLRSPIEGAKLSWLDKIPSSEQEALLKILHLQFGSTKITRKAKTDALNSFGKKKDKASKKKTKSKRTKSTSVATV